MFNVTISASLFNPEDDNPQRLINAANAALIIGKKQVKTKYLTYRVRRHYPFHLQLNMWF